MSAAAAMRLTQLHFFLHEVHDELLPAITVDLTRHPHRDGQLEAPDQAVGGCHRRRENLDAYIVTPGTGSGSSLSWRARPAART